MSAVPTFSDKLREMQVEQVLAGVDLANKSYRAGLAQGERIGYEKGFRDAINAAKDLIDRQMGGLSPTEPPRS